MKERRTTQPGLFDVARPPNAWPDAQRGKALALVQALLIEAIAIRIANAAAQCQEAGGDQDRG
jgi:hypothetical protein